MADNVCTCGHPKIWHSYIRWKGKLISIDECGMERCSCGEYVESGPAPPVMDAWDEMYERARNRGWED